jgi:hypothetical protein
MAHQFLSYKKSIVIAATLLAILAGCGVQFKPLRTTGDQTQAADKPAATGASNVVFRFFDEDFVSGGYQYAYPEASKIYIPEESGHESEVALQFDLVPGDYSGGAVCLYNLLYDATAYYSSGALEFWIKGAQGGEIAWAALVDDEKSDGKKTVVRLPVNNYGGITNAWTKISIPLADFGKRGVYWDPKKKVEVPNKFDWDQLAEFRLEIKKGDNKKFRVWVDDIFICKDVFQPRKQKEEEYWDSKDEIVTSPALPDATIKPVQTLFKNDLPAGAFMYVYGGKTAQKIQQGSSKDYSGILACYLDNDDYSGVTLALGAGKNVNCEPLRKAKAAGLAFWAKGAPGTQSIYLGILDNEPNDKKVQTKLQLGDFGKLDTNWHYFMVPLRRFQDKGKYWDADKKAEIVADMDWKAINEVRFSTNKGENKADSGKPLSLYIEDIALIDRIPGYVDPDEYWASFTSKEPDLVLHNFETPDDQTWDVAKGPKSEASYELTKSAPKNGGKAALQISYKLNDWCDIMYDYSVHKSPPSKRDWTKYWGLKFDFYTDKAFQPINVQVSDAGNEIFIASSGGEKGWNEILVPFKAFYKFPYWQPPEAVQNGKFDLDNVVKIDIKPSGDGSKGTFIIDNITLTNDREIQKAPIAEKTAVTVTGALDKTIVPKINEGIYGINAALWDGDLLKQATVDYVKAVNHKVLRYPGGLRADDDHWQEVLAKKDNMVDVDEFLDFCKQVDCEPMFTVNFGKGTPQEAAAWVKHVNIDKKANVRYWEVGNELYGDWHPNHCTGEEYGKRAVDFIKAMKLVDPTILVTVVWVLDGDWNKKVFDYTKDLADGVNVHHYSQHSGEENDPGLLAAPQGLAEILPKVRKQTADYGTPGKNYQIWLTEWNSVDFKPGPQTLSIVNALYVADYLGMLATENIEQASYWGIHNDITEQGGDYGYLSRSGAPDGDDVPRLSYWAFKMASENIRGKLAECTTSDNNVSSYLSVRPDGMKTLVLVNKYVQTRASVKIAIPGFAGKGIKQELTKATGKGGYESKPVEIGKETVVELPPYSVTAIQMK